MLSLGSIEKLIKKCDIQNFSQPDQKSLYCYATCSKRVPSAELGGYLGQKGKITFEGVVLFQMMFHWKKLTIKFCVSSGFQLRDLLELLSNLYIVVPIPCNFLNTFTLNHTTCVMKIWVIQFLLEKSPALITGFSAKKGFQRGIFQLGEFKKKTKLIEFIPLINSIA